MFLHHNLELHSYNLPLRTNHFKFDFTIYETYQFKIHLQYSISNYLRRKLLTVERRSRRVPVDEALHRRETQAAHPRHFPRVFRRWC